MQAGGSLSRVVTCGMAESPRINWKFGALLQREGVTVYRLSQELAKTVSRATLYKWSNEAPQSLDLAVLVRVLDGLERLTGKTYALEDLMTYERG
jgi:hypothetical protein